MHKLNVQKLIALAVFGARIECTRRRVYSTVRYAVHACIRAYSTVIAAQGLCGGRYWYRYGECESVCTPTCVVRVLWTRALC